MTLEQALKETMTKAGFKAIEVEYIKTEAHSLKWKRSYTWIEFKVPEAIRELPDEASRELAENIALISRGEQREWSPSTVLAIRETTGWTLPAFDSEGHRIPVPEEAAE